MGIRLDQLSKQGRVREHYVAIDESVCIEDHLLERVISSIALALLILYSNMLLRRCAPLMNVLSTLFASRGSVLVDYYLNLNGTNILDTGEIRNYFHMSLDKEGDTYKLGNFTVDTKSTDFIGNPSNRFSNATTNFNTALNIFSVEATSGSGR